MKNLIFYLAFFLCACKTKIDQPQSSGQTFHILIADTNGNIRAYRDRENFSHCSEIAKQLNLQDITKGTDSIEIRAWYSFSFSNSENLYILKGIDTAWTISYYRIHLRQYDYDKSLNWNPFTNPIVDSSFSKSITISSGNWKDSLQKLNIDTIWKLPSQCEIKMPSNLGFTDCSSHRMEIADRNQYKFVYYHCPMAYERKLKDHSHLTFLTYFDKITSLAHQYSAFIPYKFD